MKLKVSVTLPPFLMIFLEITIQYTYVFFFRQFPDLIPVHGGGRNGLEFMIGHCKQRVHQRAQLDDFVTLFMTDVAPLIISFKSLKIEVPMLHEILLLAFEFVFISLVHNKKEVIPWDSIISLFGEIGMRLGWPMAHNMVGKTSSDVGLYHQLLTLHQSQQKPNDITQVISWWPSYFFLDIRNRQERLFFLGF